MLRKPYYAAVLDTMALCAAATTEADEIRKNNESIAKRRIQRRQKNQKHDESSSRRARRKQVESNNTQDMIAQKSSGRVFGSATGERFLLRRTRTEPRTRPRPERTEQQVDAPSFIGTGVPGRVRYLFDSALRLTRNQNHMMVWGIVLVLVLVCIILVNLNRLAHKGLLVFEHHTNSKVAPFRLLADVLDEYSSAPTSWTGRAANILKRNSLWLDSLLRNSAHVVGPFLFRAFL